MKEKAKLLESKKENKLIDFLFENLDGFSKKKVKSLLKYEMVLVDGKVVTNGSIELKVGCEVKVYFSKRILPKYDLKIIYEDEDIIVIDKPAGLLSISNSKEKEVTAFRLVSDYIKKNNKNAKIFVVHRLDQGTSGVLLFAKNLKIKEVFQKEWNERVKKREYMALVENKIESTGTIRTYLTMNHFQIVHSTKNKEKGHLAITHFEVIKRGHNACYLKVLIDTGRRNQIRAHMSEKGNPIVGDKKYGAKSNPINRLCLHASKLYLLDPRGDKILKFESEVPEEITKLVDTI